MSGVSTDRRDAFAQAALLLVAKRQSRKQTFSCFLDEDLSPLVPARARDRLDALADAPTLVVNASFRYQPADALPDEVAQRGVTLDGQLGGYPRAWVADAGTGVWTALWARPGWTAILAGLEPGQTAPAGLPPAVRQALARAEVLVPPGYEAERRTHWETVCQEAGAQLASEGWAIVPELIPPLQLAAMRPYYREMVASGDLPLGDTQSRDRYHLHSEVVSNFYHYQLTSLVGRIAGEPVKPSFAYFASYRPGATLPRHLDREQCEFVLSVLLDYVPDPAGPCGWPLVLNHPRALDVPIPVDLGVGDAVIYRGRQLYHYRDRLPAGHQSTSYFLNWVREDFVGRLW
jgi:hypothetical protein